MIGTERLILRGWRDDDLPAMLAICRDPEVMEFLGPPQDAAEVRAAIVRQQALQRRDGHCYWLIEHRASGAVIGFCGLMTQPPPMPIAGEVDIGWRLARDHWRQGYAREAAAASLDWAWTRGGLDHVVAITTAANRRSWGLMERLGMRRVPGGDFDHPHVAEGSPLRRHILYRIDRR